MTLIDPDGRVISWLSQSGGVKVAQVRGRSHKELYMPRLRNGLYTVRVVRKGMSSKSKDDSIKAELFIQSLGRKKRIKFALSQAALDIANLKFSHLDE